MLLSGVVVFVVLAVVRGANNPLPTIKQYFDAQNGARTNPTDMATFITTEYKDNVVSGTKLHTVWRLTFFEDCPAVFDEAINYLNAFTAVGALELDLGMTYAAWKHAKWMVDSNNGNLDHTGSGGSTFGQRLNEFTTMSIGSGGENILYTGSGYVTGKIMVSQYIIDDGVQGRGHRVNLMKGTYKKAGVGLYYDSGRTRYFQVSVYASQYTCDKCSTITCSMQTECGWTQYLTDIGATDPCAVVNNPTPPPESGNPSPPGSGNPSTQPPAVNTPNTPSNNSTTNNTSTNTSSQNTSQNSSQSSEGKLLQLLFSLWAVLLGANTLF